MLSARIRELRKAKGITQEELAVRVNVVRQTVSKWEKGLSVPDAEQLSLLATVFEVSVGELFCQSGKAWPQRERKVPMGLLTITLYTALLHVVVGGILYCFFKDAAFMLLPVVTAPVPLLLDWLDRGNDRKKLRRAVAAMGIAAGLAALDLAAYTAYYVYTYGRETMHLILWEEMLCFPYIATALQYTVLVPIVLLCKFRKSLMTALCLCIDLATLPAAIGIYEAGLSSLPLLLGVCAVLLVSIGLTHKKR